MDNDKVSERIEVARVESVRLSDYVARLCPDQMARSSACDRWRVDDMLGHLAFVAQFQGRMITRGIAGDSSPHFLVRGFLTKKNFSKVLLVRHLTCLN